MLQVHYHNFDTCNWVVLVMQNLLCSCCVNIWLAWCVIKSLFQTPCFYLSIHFSVLFLNIPDPCLEGGILLLQLVDTFLQLVVFSPDNVLGSHCFGEVVYIGKWVKDVVIFVDFLFEVLLFLHLLRSELDLFTELLFGLFQTLKRWFLKCAYCCLRHIFWNIAFDIIKMEDSKTHLVL